MRSGRSLHFRLIVGAAVWVTTALGLSGVVLDHLFREHVTASYQAMLITQLDQLAAMLHHRADGLVELRGPLSDPRFTKPYSGLYWQAADDKGRPLVRSRSLWDSELPLSPDRLGVNEIHRHVVDGPDNQRLVAVERMISVPGSLTRLRVAVAGDLAATAPLVDAFTRTLVLSLGIIALGLIAAAAVQVHVGLRPLRNVQQALARIRGGTATRMEGAHPREVAPLVTELNALLDHFDGALTRARTQAGQLAHGLKTPLAILANEADAMARSGDAERAAALSAQIEAMRRQIDHHLARVRVAAAYALPGVRCAVAPAAEAIGRTLERLYGERGLKIGVSMSPRLAFAGDAQDLEEVLGNLVDNACKWATSRVEVTARRQDGMLVIAVDDDGPGVPEGMAEMAFEPGARFDETKPGSGLGLPIVRDIVTLYRGGIALARSPLGGLRVEVRLPAAAEA